MAKYEEQLDRIKRYYVRFKQHVDGIVVSMPFKISPDYLDDIHAFFQNCYHLKDWLKNDPSFCRKTNQEIENCVTSTPALAICADLCNGTKHLILNQTRSGDIPEIGTTQMVIEFPTDFWQYEFGQEPTTGFKLSLRPVIIHAGKEIDAFQLATEALQAWESFVK